MWNSYTNAEGRNVKAWDYQVRTRIAYWLTRHTFTPGGGEWFRAGVGAAGVSGGRQHIDDGLEGRVVAAPALAGMVLG